MNKINPAIFKIINIAMSGSIIVYGVVLQIIGKISFFSIDVVSEFGTYALGANVLVILSFLLYRSKVAHESDLQKKFPLYIICLAMNEFVAMCGFIATYLALDGNGFPFVANAAVALACNTMMFPKD